jgi:hypothetical protein
MQCGTLQHFASRHARAEGGGLKKCLPLFSIGLTGQQTFSVKLLFVSSGRAECGGCLVFILQDSGCARQWLLGIHIDFGWGSALNVNFSTCSWKPDSISLRSQVLGQCTFCS